MSSVSWKYVFSKENPSVFTLSRSASTSEAVLRRYGELSLPFPSHGRGASVTVTQAISEQISSLDIFTLSPFISGLYVFSVAPDINIPSCVEFTLF